MADRHLHGTHQQGENCGPSKISEADALAIIRRRREGEKLTAIAADYPISFTTVSRIANGVIWRHLHAS